MDKKTYRIVVQFFGENGTVTTIKVENAVWYSHDRTGVRYRETEQPQHRRNVMYELNDEFKFISYPRFGGYTVEITENK